MRNLFLAFIFLIPFLSLGQNLNNSEVPKIVRHKIHTLYPHVKHFYWAKDNNFYIVNFTTNNGENKKIVISNNGTIIEHIPLEKIPKAIKDKIYKIAPNKTLQIYKTKSKEYGEVYKVVSSESIYFIDTKGNIILSLCNGK
jgi:hypothetical protein